MHHAHRVQGHEGRGQLGDDGLDLMDPGAEVALTRQGLLQVARPLRIYNNKLVLGKVLRLLLKLAILFFLFCEGVVTQYLHRVLLEYFCSFAVSTITPSQELQRRSKIILRAGVKRAWKQANGGIYVIV